MRTEPQYFAHFYVFQSVCLHCSTKSFYQYFALFFCMFFKAFAPIVQPKVFIFWSPKHKNDILNVQRLSEQGSLSSAPRPCSRPPGALVPCSRRGSTPGRWRRRRPPGPNWCPGAGPHQRCWAVNCRKVWLPPNSLAFCTSPFFFSLFLIYFFVIYFADFCLLCCQFFSPGSGSIRAGLSGDLHILLLIFSPFACFLPQFTVISAPPHPESAGPMPVCSEFSSVVLFWNPPSRPAIRLLFFKVGAFVSSLFR